MRNLTTIQATQCQCLPRSATSGGSTAPDHESIASLAINPDEDSIYSISECHSPDGDRISLSIFKSSRQPSPSSFVYQTERIANFQSSLPVLEGWPEGRSQVVDFKFLPESESLCVVLAGGEIVLVNVGIWDDSGDNSEKVEVVGAVDFGIRAAQWSSDDELLVLVTGDGKLLEMTKDFEVISEASLRTDDFGEDKPVDVGWGNKKTQFHGSLGKQAAQESKPDLTQIKSSNDDDGLPRISWRGDGAFFCVSSMERTAGEEGAGFMRIIRVYSRTAALQSTSEPTDGLEHPLSWQPSGSIIASSQRTTEKGSGKEKQQVIFYERNGLRRYEFGLRESGGEDEAGGRQWRSRVRELSWNSDSTFLAVWIERLVGTDDGEDGPSKHVVQIWTRNNYHWYLKREVEPRLLDANTISRLAWHPEKPLVLYISSPSGFESRTFVWDVFTSPLPSLEDPGSVAVVDGSDLLITPFRYQNVPPPMCTERISTSQPSSSTSWMRPIPVHASFSSCGRYLAVLQADTSYEIWSLGLREFGSNHTEDAMRPKLVVSSEKVGPDDFTSGTSLTAIQIALSVVDGGPSEEEKFSIGILTANNEGEHDSIYQVGFSDGLRMGDQAQAGRLSWSRLHAVATRLVSVGDKFIVHFEDGSGTTYDLASETRLPCDLPQTCTRILGIAIDGSRILPIGLSAFGRLYAGAQRTLATDCTSVAIGSGFLIYTTSSHEMRFIKTESLIKAATSEDEGGDRAPEDVADVKEVLSRRLERGSRIVTVVPSAMKVILQMPRGNLESVCPRPLVLQVVCYELDRQDYLSAFINCRRHRIDLNILYDHDPRGFNAHLAIFVEQVKEADHLNLFLSSLRDEDVTTTLYSFLKPLENGSQQTPLTVGKRNSVLDAVRKELETKDIKVYVQSILTAYVCKDPPEYESALAMLVDLRKQDSALAEEAIKYIIFLSDANKLFDIALGMYDFATVLMIAKYSQKDPKEYVPFLRELRRLDTHVQRYRIDHHLKRYPNALRNLSKAGDEHFSQAVTYMKNHELYNVAIEAYSSDPEKLKVILDAKGDWLILESEPAEAALVFMMAGQRRKAVNAYMRANLWQEAFAVALALPMADDELLELADQVADRLRGKKRLREAARVLVEYKSDTESAVDFLIQANDFSEAQRIALTHARHDLIDSAIYPGAFNAADGIIESIEEMGEQCDKQVQRLAELKVKRETEPETFWDETIGKAGAEGLDNVDVMTDAASTVGGTEFTRYTRGAMSTANSRLSKSSKRSGKGRRKEGRKKAGGKKGTIYEEEYVLGSLRKLAEVRFTDATGEVQQLLRTLITFSTSESSSSLELREKASELQVALSGLEDKLRIGINKVWGEGGTHARPPPGQESEEDKERRETELRRAAWLKMARQGAGLPVGDSDASSGEEDGDGDRLGRPQQLEEGDQYDPPKLPDSEWRLPESFVS